MWPMIVVCGFEMARSRRSVCAFLSSLKRPGCKSKHLVRKVERVVGKDVGIDALQDRKSFPKRLFKPVTSRCCSSICSTESPPV